MKKIMLLTAAIVMVAGCTAEEKFFNRNEKTVTKEFSAEFASVTRTSIDSELNVDWKSGDVIRYYSAASGSVKTFTVPNDGHTAYITTEIGADDSFVIAAYGADGISDNTGKVCTLTGAVKAEQSGTFSDAHVSIAKTYDVNSGTLAFTNLTSMIKFSLTRTNVSYITFTPKDSTKIHANGQLNVSFSSTTASAAFPEGEGGYTIKVNAGGSGTFYIATLPCEIKGFTIKLYDDNGAALGQVASENTLVIKDNNIVNLGNLDSRITPVEPTDLSANGTANCYIVSSPDVYKFKATVKGGSSEALDGTPFKASVLWESFGTDETPTVGDVVTNVKYKDGYISFQSGRNGNAVIAVKDIDDEILWSWHIWVCEDFSPDATAQVYNNSAGTMMDRNLGATSATPGDVHALGLLYQWGRKDPFLSGNSISSSTQAASTLSWPSAVSSNSSNGTIAYTIAHSTTFITSNSNNYDWYYTGSSSTDDTRWQTSDKTKGIYDPCPAGWRVPDGGINGIWSKAFGTSSYWQNASNWDSTNKGMDFGKTDKTIGSGTIWYPAAGCRININSSLGYVGNYGLYWSGTPNNLSMSSLDISNNSIIDPSSSYYRADGRSVRCVQEGTQPLEKVINLSSDGTANCYMVSTKGQYKFKTVKGNSNESVGDVKGVKVLWESFGTDVTPSVGDLIKADVSYADNYITFSTNDTYKEGNAVIAAYSDANCTDGNVLWSWHIWLTDKPKEQVCKNSAGTMMDRNLGATSATPGDVHALGLLYQWGRKDPFLSGNSISSSTPAASTLNWPSNVSSDLDIGRIAYAVAHPTTFIGHNFNNYDWYYTGSSSTDNTRWQTSDKEKGLYDPCPAGWRVPDGGDNGVWSKAFGSSLYFVSGPWDDTNRGMDFGSGNGKSSSMQLGAASSIWYPAAGNRSSGDGMLETIGLGGVYWSCTPGGSRTYYAYCLSFSYNGKVTPSDYIARAFGRSVRCLSESK